VANPDQLYEDSVKDAVSERGTDEVKGSRKNLTGGRISKARAGGTARKKRRHAGSV